MNETDRRKQLWQELENFCRYIERWYPRIDEIYLFGSYLWTKEPADIDIWVKGNTAYLLNGYKKLFPNIHLFKRGMPEDQVYNRILVWSRAKEKIVELPELNREDMLLNEVRGLRKQIDILKKYAREHSHTPSYNPYWMLAY